MGGRGGEGGWMHLLLSLGHRRRTEKKSLVMIDVRYCDRKKKEVVCVFVA